MLHIDGLFGFSLFKAERQMHSELDDSSHWILSFTPGLIAERITDHATYNDPHRYSEGEEYLFVNGVLSIDKGKATGDRGGRPLRRI